MDHDKEKEFQTAVATSATGCTIILLVIILNKLKTKHLLITTLKPSKWYILCFTVVFLRINVDTVFEGGQTMISNTDRPFKCSI